jgi:hypothetical protein
MRLASLSIWNCMRLASLSVWNSMRLALLRPEERRRHERVSALRVYLSAPGATRRPRCPAGRTARRPCRPAAAPPRRRRRQSRSCGARLRWRRPPSERVPTAAPLAPACDPGAPCQRVSPTACQSVSRLLFPPQLPVQGSRPFCCALVCPSKGALPSATPGPSASGRLRRQSDGASHGIFRVVLIAQSAHACAW